MSTRGRDDGILIGVGAGLMLVVLLVLQSFIGSGLFSTRTVTSVTTTSATLATTTSTITEVIANNQTWNIVESDITSPGYAGAIATCVAFGFPCPKADYPLPAMLVMYQEAYYYVSDVQVSGNGSVPPIVHYTVWYTNSTVYCVSPQIIRYITCP